MTNDDTVTNVNVIDDKVTGERTPGRTMTDDRRIGAKAVDVTATRGKGADR